MKLSEMKIYLLDINPDMTAAWEKYFSAVPNIQIINADFANFMNSHAVDCVVSPANSYGLMDGGYDYAISAWFGWDLQKKVQKYILENLCGEQPVGTSILIDTGKDGIKLIHTPSMRYPDRIREPLIIYQCMRTCLMTAMANPIKTIVIPAFGGFYGQMPPDTVAQMMWRAWEQLNHIPSEISWRYADKASYFQF